MGAVDLARAKAVDLADAEELLENLAARSGVDIRVFREPTTRMYMGTVPIEGVGREMLREEFGSGEFTLRAHRAGEWLKGVPTIRVRL